MFAACRTHGHKFEGSEDATLWRTGLAFVSSGLVPSATQPGLILLANLSGNSIPSVTPVAVKPTNLSSTFGFRPHGLHLDNTSSRLYAISHSATLKEESIFVFDVHEGADANPALHFRYALTSPNFEYHPRTLLWFLNDLAVVDGENELFATQLGPFYPVGPTKALWRCTWRDADVLADGRLPATCARALSGFIGLNGIAIEPNASYLYVNDEFGAPNHTSQVRRYARRADGSLEARGILGLNGSSIDNIERDRSSGELLMGQYDNLDKGVRVDAALLARRDREAPFGYSAARETAAALPARAAFQVSTALRYGRWTLLGSPWDRGPYLCDHYTPEIPTVSHPTV